MKLINYYKTILEDAQNIPSLKRIMASIAFIVLQSICIYYSKLFTEFIIGTEVSLILTLLGIVAYQDK
jgi:hypothetical protein